MTISSETTRAGPYSGNGSTTVFAYGFKIYDQADLEVVLTNSSGVETVQTITTHYTVSGVGVDGGGNATMGTPPATNESLTIRRKLDLLQAMDLTNQGAFVGETHERAFDEIVQMLQQIDEEGDRSVRLPLSTSASDSAEMPAPAANKSIA